MTTTPLPDADPSNPRPFGAQQPRSGAGQLFWGVLYFAWIAFLVVMAYRFSGYGR